jgi:hypothetical protein
MLAVYLFSLWLLYTLAWRSIEGVRRSGFAFFAWFLLTAIMLWPVSKRAVEFCQSSPLIQATVQQMEAEWDAELRREFPEYYSRREADAREPKADGEGNAGPGAPAAEPDPGAK